MQDKIIEGMEANGWNFCHGDMIETENTSFCIYKPNEIFVSKTFGIFGLFLMLIGTLSS